MKKIFGFIAVIGVFTLTTAAVAPTKPAAKPPVKAAEIFIPLGTNGEMISLLDLSTMKIKDVESISGRKMKFGDRLKFKIAQKQLRDNIAPDGTFDLNRVKKLVAKQSKGGETGFHVGGFLLGFLLGLIGVLIAYLINDDYKQNRRKWAWIGTGVAIVVSLLFLI